MSLSIYTGNLVNPGHEGVGPISNLFLFMLSEVLGGALAAGVFRLTHGSLSRNAEAEAKDAEAPSSEPQKPPAGDEEY